VKKKTETRKYKIAELKPPNKYVCQLEPNTASSLKLTFKEVDLELA
jgi:hypothetical protein